MIVRGRSKDATQAFAEKLRLIMEVTGCETQKALYSRLKSLNTDTGYDPVRAYKWIQGRSTPRNHTVYEDLARLLDMGLDGEILRTSSYESFRGLISERFGKHLPAPAAAPNSVDESASVASVGSVPGYLIGRYLTFSLSWSPHHAGKLIAGVTTFSQGQDAAVRGTYVENLPWGKLELSGRVQRFGRNLSAQFVSYDSEIVFAITYALPSPPGLVLGGVVGGVTLHDAEMRPVACRILSVRLPDGDDAAPDLNAYLEPRADSVLARLEAFGFRRKQAALLAPDILSLLLETGEKGLIEASVPAINVMIGNAS